jgi:hypothetical protein
MRDWISSDDERVAPPVGGALVDGVPFTLTVANSLSGATTIYDDCSGGAALSNLWNYYWHSPEVSRWSEQRRAPGNADFWNAPMALPHTNNLTQYICGAAQSTTGGIWSADVLFATIYDTRPSFPFYSTWAWWERTDPAWVFDAGDRNYKFFAYAAGAGPYTGQNWYASFQAYNVADPAATPGAFIDVTSDNLKENGWNDDSLLTGLYLGPGKVLLADCPNMAKNWLYREFQFRYDSASTAYAKSYASSVLIPHAGTFKFDGADDPWPGTQRTEAVGGYNRSYPHNENWRYWADVYYDRQQSDDTAIVLTNNATYFSSTKLAHQPRTSATATTITCKCRKGIHTSGTVHVHVRSQVRGNQYLGTRTMT